MTARNKFRIDISIQCDEWKKALPGLRDLARHAVRASLKHFETGTESEISIVFADDSFIRELNSRYRSKDKPTNVLSFPQDGGPSLGDVVLAFETIKKESREQSKKLKEHTAHMLVHGTLHLMGMDHENDDEAEEMESLEILVLKGLGVKNPYETKS